MIPLETQNITPTCRKNRGVGEAWDEAVLRLREIYDAQVAHDPDLTFSVTLSRERPRWQEITEPVKSHA